MAKLDKKWWKTGELVGKSCIVHIRWRESYKKQDTLNDVYIVDITRAEVVYDYDSNKDTYTLDGRNVSIEYDNLPKEQLQQFPWYDIIASDDYYLNDSEFEDENFTIEWLPREEVLRRLNEKIQEYFNYGKE
jgi:hypothetical protein